MAIKKAAAQDDFSDEQEVVEEMLAAQEISDTMFGAQSNLFGVHKIYDFLEENEEDQFMIDLKRFYRHAQLAHKTQTPTPEMVFGLFKKVFDI
jgi:hypothetical protein